MLENVFLIASKESKETYFSIFISHLAYTIAAMGYFIIISINIISIIKVEDKNLRHLSMNLT